MRTLPLTGRQIPVIADAFVDPKFGTGVVKVTPAHDPNDFEAGKRNGLDSVAVIGFDGKMTAAAGAAYAGLDRFEARKKVLRDLDAAGLRRGEKSHSSRSRAASGATRSSSRSSLCSGS